MNKKILIFAPFGRWPVNHQIDAVIGSALIKRGCEVLSLRCDSFFENCPISGKPLGENKKCKICQKTGSDLFSLFEIPVLFLSKIVTFQDKIDCRNWSESITPDNFNDAVFEENKIGKWVLCGIYSYFVTGIYDYSFKDYIKMHRSYLFSGALLTRAFKNLIKDFYPDHLICFHSMLSYYRVIMKLAMKKSIPVLVHDRGLIDESYMFTNNESIVTPDKRIESWQKWKNIPLTLNECLTLKKHLHEREEGKNINFSPYYQFKSYKKLDLYKSLRISDNKPVVAFFSSGDWEMEMQKDDISSTFNNQRQAIISLIELFKNRNEYLIIRHHPNIVGKIHKDSPFLKEMFVINRNIPENVRVIMPYENITSYAIMDIASAFISSSGTTGYESILRGISGYSIRNNLYSTLNVGFDMIDSASDCNKIIDQSIIKTKNFNILNLKEIFRAAYYLFFRLNYTFKSIGIVDGNIADIKLDSLDELNYGNDKYLDRICDHIMFNKSLFPVPDEKHLLRSDNQENEFLKKEFDTIITKRKQKRIKFFNQKYKEPLLSVIQIVINNFDDLNIDNNFLIQSIDKSRFKNIELLKITLNQNEIIGNLLSKIASTLNLIKGKYLYFAFNNCHIDESFFSFSIDLLENKENFQIDGILSGAWLDQNSFELKEIFTNNYYENKLNNLKSIKELIDNNFQLLCLFLFKTSSFENFINNFINNNKLFEPEIFIELTLEENIYLNISKIYKPLITIYQNNVNKNIKTNKQDSLKELGIINYKSKNFLTAYNYFIEAYKEDLKDYDLIIWLAALCCDVGKYNEAINLIQNYLKIKNADIISLSILALIAKKNNNSNAFAEIYEYACLVIPNNPNLSKILLLNSKTKAYEVLFSKIN